MPGGRWRSRPRTNTTYRQDRTPARSRSREPVSRCRTPARSARIRLPPRSRIRRARTGGGSPSSQAAPASRGHREPSASARLRARRFVAATSAPPGSSRSRRDRSARSRGTSGWRSLHPATARLHDRFCGRRRRSVPVRSAETPRTAWTAGTGRASRATRGSSSTVWCAPCGRSRSRFSGDRLLPCREAPPRPASSQARRRSAVREVWGSGYSAPGCPTIWRSRADGSLRCGARLAVPVHAYGDLPAQGRRRGFTAPAKAT